MAFPCEIGLYINPRAGSGAKRLVEPLINDPRVFVDSIPFQKTIDSLPLRLIVVGGERSVITVAGEIYRRGENPTLGIVPGGSGNVTFNNLERHGNIVSVSEFIDGSQAGVVIFRPGQIGEEIFNNQVGFGAYEQATGSFNEALRFMPDRMRTMLYKILATVPAVFSDEPINMYSVSPYIGKVRAFPEQDFFGNSITHGQIRGEQKAPKLAMTLMFWQMGLADYVPDALFHRTQRERFTADIQSSDIWIDGDTSRNPYQGEVEIKRIDRGISVVGLR